MTHINDLDKMRVPGTDFSLMGGAGGKWVANYRLNLKGKKRGKNIGAIGDTVQEAVQKANDELTEYLATHQPDLWV